MIHVKPSPNSIDISIQELQVAVYNGILKAFPDASYECYGRCSPTRTDKGYVATVFDGGYDYRSALWDDGADIVSFFGYTGNMIRDNTHSDAQVHLVVFCNLDKLYPTSIYRMDEEVRLEFTKIFGKVLFRFHYQSLELGIDKVLKEYRGSLLRPEMNRMDAHPLHCFRFNFSISYNQFQSNSLKL